MAMPEQSLVAVTGGARGIGRATAATFAAAGAPVAIGDLDGALAERAAGELGGRAVGLRLDAADPDCFARFLAAAEERTGRRLRVLVNNAGIMTTGRFLDEADATADRMVDVNLRAVLIGSRLAARRLVPAGRGHIVNVSTMAGSAGFPGLVTYCATKYGVLGLSEALRAELHGTGVGVTVVRPAVVRTELSAGVAVPRGMRRLATVEPEDVARAIVAAVGRDAPDVWVPAAFGGLMRLTLACPRPLRAPLARAAGLGRFASGADPAARAAYDRRYGDGGSG